MKDNSKIILALETSCDETAAAVLKIDKNEIVTLSAAVKSQVQLHAKMGGVVPEAAARAHIKNIRPVVEKGLTDAFATTPLSGDRRQVGYMDLLKKIDYIAVTQGPGLIPSLIVGVEFAKALSLGTGKPLMGIDHMAGHLYSPFGRELLNTKYQTSKFFPAVSLIVSGGHTMLVLMTSLHNYNIIGQTVDDAAGEAFDKVAKLLNLPYPGGPEISKLAERGNPKAINFPRPMIHSKNFDFSFSGLKTAVLYYLRDHGELFPSFHLSTPLEVTQNSPKGQKRGTGVQKMKADVCAGFQQAVIDVLIAKTIRAAKQYRAKTITLSGGVSANKNLRRAFEKTSKQNHLTCLIAPLSLAGDNAEMIGLAAAIQLAKKPRKKNGLSVAANPNLNL